jgi:hypothetical protein
VALGLKKAYGKEESADLLKKGVTESHKPRNGVVMQSAGCGGLIQTGQQSFSPLGSCMREKGSYMQDELQAR